MREPSPWPSFPSSSWPWARREEILHRTATGEIGPDHALRLLEAMRWVDALLYHIWRAVHHLGGENVKGPAEATSEVFSEPGLPGPGEA